MAQGLFVNRDTLGDFSQQQIADDLISVLF